MNCMINGLNWAIIYKNKVRALFVTRWQAEMFIDALHNAGEWSIKYIREDEGINDAI